MSGIVLGDALVDRRLLHREADIRHAELLGVGQGRILGHQFRTRRVDRLAVHRDRVGQIPRIGARLAVAVVDAAVLHRHALDAAGQIDRPGHGVGIGAADLLDRGLFGLGEIAVPAELLQHAVGELRIAVLDLGVLGIGALGQQVVLLLDLVPSGMLDLRRSTPKRARKVPPPSMIGQVGVVEQRRSRMPEFRACPSTATAGRNSRRRSPAGLSAHAASACRTWPGSSCAPSGAPATGRNSRSTSRRG